jgi:hypothetical protein
MDMFYGTTNVSVHEWSYVAVFRLKNAMCLRLLSLGSSISLKELELFVEDWALSLRHHHFQVYG